MAARTEDSAELQKQNTGMHTKNQRVKRHGALFVAMGIICVAFVALIGSGLASPAVQATTAPPDQVAYIVPIDTSPGNMADSTQVANNGSPGTDAAMVNATQATIQGTTAITGAITVKEVGYDVILPTLTSLNGQINSTDQLTKSATANTTGTITLNGAYDVILPNTTLVAVGNQANVNQNTSAADTITATTATTITANASGMTGPTNATVTSATG